MNSTKINIKGTINIEVTVNENGCIVDIKNDIVGQVTVKEIAIVYSNIIANIEDILSEQFSDGTIKALSQIN